MWDTLRMFWIRRLSRFALVYAAAGSPNAIFPIPYQMLVDITGGQVVDIAKA